jgi:hypothetical protein
MVRARRRVSHSRPSSVCPLDTHSMVYLPWMQALSTTFGVSGTKPLSIGTIGITPMIQSTGRIVIGGYSGHNSGDYSVFRLWP